jgi:two-component system, sensor histidine kinase and response regulator
MAKTILVVDDEPEIGKLVSHRLGSEGYHVRIAEDGEQALRLANIIKPDLIILDVGLPGMNGAEVCMKLKEQEKTKNIPIIFLTALKTKEDDVRLGFDIGNHTIFAKPFDAKEFLGAVREAIASRT